jgi:hypothetical protein
VLVALQKNRRQNLQQDQYRDAGDCNAEPDKDAIDAAATGNRFRASKRFLETAHW